MTEKITLDQRQFEEFYKKFGSDFYQMQSQVNRDFGQAFIDTYFRSVSFVVSVISTIGVIAGFGFTAYSYVQSHLLFFIGESILLFSILDGLIWIQKIYKNENESLFEAQSAHRDHFKKRNDCFKEIYDQLLINYNPTASTYVFTEQNLKKFEELKQINLDSIELFKPKNEIKTPPELYPKRLYLLLVTGMINLLLSFFIYSLIFNLCAFTFLIYKILNIS